MPPGSLVRARAAAERDDRNALAWARLAQAAQGAGADDEALAAAEQALALAIETPALSAAHAAVMVLASSGGEDALRRFLRDPRSAELPTDIRLRAALECGELELARELAEHGSSGDVLSVLTWLYVTRGEYARAIRAGRSTQERGAAGPGLLTNMAFAHASLGNLANAIKLTRQARTLAPHDRLIGFNLAGFLRLAGRLDDALEVLKQLRKGARLDIDLALVTADLLAENGQGDEARRVLQGVRTSQEWAVADHVRRAELEANLALLRWMTDRERADATVTALMRALRDSQYRSLSIGYLLANLLRDRKNAQHLATAISGLRAHHDDNELHGLRMHHAVLTRERDEAVHHARAWARHEPLNPAAAALAIHLISDIGGHYDEAADLGVAALRRAPARSLLVNNTAYALCLAGRADEAKRILGPASNASGESLTLMATRALAAIVSGHPDAGRRGYERAASLADDAAFATLVKLNCAMALSSEDELPREIPRAWKERSSFWITGQRLEREMGVTLEALIAHD